MFFAGRSPGSHRDGGSWTQWGPLAGAETGYSAAVDG
jgi:hypothetical protein